MSENGAKKKLLLLGANWDKFGGSFLGDAESWGYELNSDAVAALGKIASESFDGFLVDRDYFQNILECCDHSQERKILESLPIGLAVVDHNQDIVWFNRQFKEWCVMDELIGKRFYVPLGRPEMLGPDYCPFRTIRMTNKPAFTPLRQKDQGRFLHMSTAPIFSKDGKINKFLVQLHDVTDQSKEELIRLRLREAGRELADISKEDILKLSQEERVNILRMKIAKYAKEILQFDTIEIRILSSRVPLLLEPLLAIGMAEAAKQRTLYALQENNGITGWVAYHKRSYLMEDPTEDIFYIEGIPGARSSITVPLLYHGNLIGTFNVESQQPKAFNEQDLRMLETYAEDVAAAIHTLDLLSFEQKDSAFRILAKVHVDTVTRLSHILTECSGLLQNDHAGTAHERAERVETIHRIQDDVRAIQETIIHRGGEVVPEIPPDLLEEEEKIDHEKYKMLRDKRILVIDPDSSAGAQLSKILFFYGCKVEMAARGADALKLIEATHYDAFVCCVKIAGMSAYDFFEKVQKMLDIPYVPFIYVKGYGHDGDHVMTKAKVAGVLGYVYKPFKLPQLLRNLKLVMTEAKQRNGE